MMTDANDYTPSLPMTIPVDLEHIGIRITLPILAIASGVGGFVLGTIITPLIDESLGSLCLSMIFALGGLIFVPQLVEPILKRFWSSGRQIELDETGLIVKVRRKNKDTLHFFWGQPLNLTAYYWEVETRKSRVKRGWFCVAVQATQSEQELIVYCFISPDSATDIVGFRDYFFHLLPKQAREEMTNIDPRAAATQERYRRLESHRWFDGAEVSEEHFMILLQKFQEHGSFKRAE